MPLKDTIIGILILLILITAIEFFRIKVIKYILLFFSSSIKRVNELLRQVKTDTSLSQDDKINKEKEVSLIEEKINVVISEFEHALNLIARGIQLFGTIIFINYCLYIFPVTNSYIKEFINFEISILIVIKELLSGWLLSSATWQSIGKILIIIIATSIAICGINIFNTGLKHLIQALLIGDTGREKQLQTLINILKTSIKIIIIALAIILVLSSLGIDITPIVAGAGILGLALSFGSQSLVKDVINGFFILTENQFAIGDIIEIDGTDGTVENMTLRSTTLRDLSGRAHIIPNSQITKVTVYTKGWARAHLDIAITYKEDIDKAIGIIKQTADKMYTELPDKVIAEPEVLGVSELKENSILIKLIMNTAPAQQWFVEREFRKRIKYAFEQNNIEIPFPQRIVHIPEGIILNKP